MKTKLLKISLLLMLFLLFTGCNCKECETEKEKLSIQLNEAKKSNQEIIDIISDDLSDRYQIFRDLTLPLFLGEKRNGLNQNLHIEGGIENPFFVVGRFNSKVDDNIQNCTINNLEIEIIATRSSDVKFPSYEFDTSKPIKLYRENNQLKMSFTVKAGSANKVVPVKVDESAKNVTAGEIIDITVVKGFPYKSNDIKIGDGDYQIKCCDPVICKSKIYFP